MRKLQIVMMVAFTALALPLLSALELVRNGDFTTGISGWTVQSGAKITIESQRLKLVLGTKASSKLSQNGLKLESPGSYLLSLVIKADNASQLQVSLSAANGHDLLEARASQLVCSLHESYYQFYFETTRPEQVTLVFEPSTNASNGRNSTFWVDRVSLRTTGPWMDAHKSTAERVSLLMAHMNLDEKAGQMVQSERNAAHTGDVKRYGIGSILSGGGSVPADNSPAGWINLYNDFQAEAMATRLAIPIIYGIDAVHGHGNVHGATMFPHNIGLGATRDPVLLEKIGAATALEVAATGLNWTFGPCVAVTRDERWGRSYESYGESPELQALLTGAYIRGLQGKPGSTDWLKGPHVAGTAKHFMGDGGAEWKTGEGSYTIDRGDIRTLNIEQLKAIHAQGYIEAVKMGIPAVMASFSMVKGIHMSVNKALLSDYLKGSPASGGLGFEGFIIGDWDAFGLATEIGGDYATKVLAAFNAGMDMSMEQSRWSSVISILKEGLKSGKISQARIDDAVRRILTVKFNAGIFDKPWALDRYADRLGSTDNRAVAAQAVRESLVLLKNDRKILPLPKNARIFVSGPLSDNVGLQSGGWTLQWQGGSDRYGQRLTPGTSILDGLKAIAAANGGVIITDPAQAAKCDLAVVVVGEVPYSEGVGDVSLTGKMDLVDGKAASGNLQAIQIAKDLKLPVVVVIVSGRPLIITKELPSWNALVAAWLPGSEGAAVADVLYGETNFRGVLPVSWPRSLEQLPINVGDPDYDQKSPLFPFGFGMKYAGDMRD